MIVKICALVIGLMVFGAGVYYLQQSKDNAESRKIYQITAAIGAVIAVAGVIGLLL